jgi:CheY-like chemotaxis protein
MMVELKRILLVEDNVNDVELTLSALASINLANSVDVVDDGVEALDYLNFRGRFSERPKCYPVVVILDLKLPKVNGLEVLKEIREDPKLKHLPVVILTSSREEKDIITGYDLGVNAYVVKPVDFKAFALAIKELGSFWAIINEVPPKH